MVHNITLATVIIKVVTKSDYTLPHSHRNHGVLSGNFYNQMKIH